MKFKTNKINIVFLILIVLIPILALAQVNTVEFGKNRIQYKKLKWKFYESPNFYTYTSQGGNELGKFVAQVAEAELPQLESFTEYSLQRKGNIVVYSSYDEYKQSNIGLGIDWQQAGGLTKLVNNKIVVYIDGNHTHLKNQIRQGITNPRDHHRPAFDAAQAVNALLHGAPLHHIFQIKSRWLFNQPFNFDAPGGCFQSVRLSCRIRFVGTKFVEVVVRGGVFLRGKFLNGHGPLNGRLTGRQRRQFRGSIALGKSLTVPPTRQARSSSACTPATQHVTPRCISLFAGDLTAQRVNKAIVVVADQHDLLS